mgnify:CR=1 FL=1
MLEDLKGKVVLVTGGSTGIGAEVAKSFGAHGAKVMVHYNASEADAKAVVDAIAAKGGTAQMIKGDVMDRSQPAKIIAATLKAFGRIDVLVNNAGGMLGRKPLAELTDEQYDKVMDLNAWSVLAFTREVAPIMQKQGGGNIINTTSIAARGAVLYAASKGFVSTFTRGMAKELWALGKIRVNGVAPGVITTPFHERYSNAQQMEAMRGTVPMGYLAEAHECVGAFLYLASDQMSGYVTGQVIEVNGGQLMP